MGATLWSKSGRSNVCVCVCNVEMVWSEDELNEVGLKKKSPKFRSNDGACNAFEVTGRRNVRSKSQKECVCVCVYAAGENDRLRFQVMLLKQRRRGKQKRKIREMQTLASDHRPVIRTKTNERSLPFNRPLELANDVRVDQKHVYRQNVSSGRLCESLRCRGCNRPFEHDHTLFNHLLMVVPDGCHHSENGKATIQVCCLLSTSKC